MRLSQTYTTSCCISQYWRLGRGWRSCLHPGDKFMVLVRCIGVVGLDSTMSSSSSGVGLRMSTSSSASSMWCVCCREGSRCGCCSRFLSSPAPIPTHHHTSYIIHHPSTSCPLNGDRDLLPDGPLQLHLRGRWGVEEESPISEPRLNRTETGRQGEE